MSPVETLLVSATDCHLCDHAHGVLHALEGTYPMRVREIDWESEEGQAMVGRDGVAFPPALYFGSQLVGYGRLSERRLRRLLEARTQA